LKKLEKEFVTSLLTVLLAILSIALFISSGGSLWFYIAVVIAIAFGFYNAWLISQKQPVEEIASAPKNLRTRSRKR